jgi:hypothetical protein
MDKLNNYNNKEKGINSYKNPSRDIKDSSKRQ